MLTNSDITKLKNIFVTKEQFYGLEGEFGGLKQEFTSLKREMITRFDAVMGELQAMREELAVIVYRQSEHTDTLENHDHRLVSLEKTVQPKSE